MFKKIGSLTVLLTVIGLILVVFALITNMWKLSLVVLLVALGIKLPVKFWSSGWKSVKKVFTSAEVVEEKSKPGEDKEKKKTVLIIKKKGFWSKFKDDLSTVFIWVFTRSLVVGCFAAFIFFVAPKIYALAHPNEHKKGTYTKGNIVTDVQGNSWQEYKLDIDKEWSSFEFTEGPPSNMWAGKDSIFVLFRGSDEVMVGYTGEMQCEKKKPRRIPSYSNYFDIRLPEASKFEHDQVLFWLRVN